MLFTGARVSSPDSVGVSASQRCPPDTHTASSFDVNKHLRFFIA